jgi:hypothetical protein
MKTQKLFLKEDSHASAPYKILKILNTVEWNVGERLTKDKVKAILKRRIGRNARPAVEVEIK